MTVERRASEGHISQEDVRRYTSAGVAIERIARLRGSAIATITSATLDAWAAGAPPPRALAGFHLPLDAQSWLRDLAAVVDTDGSTLLLRALDRLRALDYGIVLSPAPEPVGPLLTVKQTVAAPARTPAHRPDPETARLLVASPPTWAPFANSPSRLGSAQRLWDQLTSTVAEGEVLQVGAGARHEVVTETLRHAAAVVGQGYGLRLMYVDGSEAEPFSLIAPVQRARRAERTIRVGLMSMRHTELDAAVDGYWFRNRLVSTSRTLAETDRFCTATTITKLHELYQAGIGRVELVHTGFEPAVIGFYRGLLTWLADGVGQIEVQPLYLIGDLVEGTLWGARRGAADDS
ncbi:hypothetical protein KALB_5241 [Kutzneria albida DSM 43870]|uniref:Uncharacterized protein n=1 Tax=Kutzneria albida DSM 43870 TaxID=1449976 RepID=W5WBQ4_9PSEU|nr:hypothetical protein KALB_5241 [Kutzneria albida DSM 43870]